MRFRNKMKLGVSILILLLLFTTCLSIINIMEKIDFFDENKISLSEPEDSYEPNDHYLEAYDITFNEGMWLSAINGTGTQANADYYKINIKLGFEHLKANLTFSNSLGNIDLVLCDNLGIPINGSVSTTDNEYIDFTVPINGTYYLLVLGQNASNSYDLWWISLLQTAPDDWMEDNDDFWNASGIVPNYYFDLKIVDEDEDWFRLILNPGYTIDIAIYFSQIEGDLDLELWDPAYFPRVKSNSTFNDEFISFTADVSGEWRIRVYHKYGNSSVSYDLDIWINTGGPGDDWMEENDDFWNARGIGPGYYPGLKIVFDDDDWYQLYLDVDDLIEVYIYFNQFEGDLQLELWDPSNVQRIVSHTTNDWEYVSFTANIAGEWRIKVFHEYKDSDVYYDLDVRFNPKGDDPYELNNYMHEAYFLGENERTWLEDIHGPATSGDEDWYRIDVTPGFEHLIVKLVHNHSLGNIYISIFDEWSGIVIASNFSMTDFKSINFNLTHPGIYLIQIHGDYMGNKYNLWWDDLRTDFRPDDNYEENDDPMSAYYLHEQRKLLQDIDLLALQYDNDWYRIDIKEGELRLIVTVLYDYAEGAIGIEIYDWELTEITNNFTMRDHEFIDYVVPSNGTYYIRIYGDSSGNVYDIWWETLEEEKDEIPGYDILILIGAIVGISAIIVKNKRSKIQNQ